MSAWQDLHKFVQLALRVANQLGVRAALKDDSAANVKDLIEMLEEVDAVGDHDSSFRGEQSIGANDMI